MTVGHERIKGLRAVGQRRGEGWEVNTSRMLAVDVAALCTACASPRHRSKWLPFINSDWQGLGPASLVVIPLGTRDGR